MQQENFGLASDSLPKIKVVFRKRPLNTKERNKNDKDIIDMRDDQSLIVKEIK